MSAKEAATVGTPAWSPGALKAWDVRTCPADQGDHVHVEVAPPPTQGTPEQQAFVRGSGQGAKQEGQPLLPEVTAALC